MMNNLMFADYDLPESSEHNGDRSENEQSEDICVETLLFEKLGPNGKQFFIDIKQKFPNKWRSYIKANFWCDNQICLPRWLTEDDKPEWLSHFFQKADRGFQELWLQSGFFKEDPQWLEELLIREKAQISRCFFITGNIGDYAFDVQYGYRPVRDLVTDAFLKRKSLVFKYSLSRGLECCTPDANTNHFTDEIKCLMSNSPSHASPPVMNISQQVMWKSCQVFDAFQKWLNPGLSTTKDNHEPIFGQTEDDTNQSVCLIVENAHLLFPEQMLDAERGFLIDTLLSWASSQSLFHSSHCILLLADELNDISEPLRCNGGKIEQIDVPRPSQATIRLKFLISLFSHSISMIGTRYLNRQQPVFDGYEGKIYEKFQAIAEDTAGMTLLGIEDLFQEMSVSPVPVFSRSKLMALKKNRLAQESEGLLQVIDPKITLSQVGGYQHLKKNLKQTIAQLKKAQTDPVCRSILPKGILFLGPPGTGKTLVAETIAKEANVSFVKLGDFRSMYVGQSERNLSKVLDLIKSLHPVIVFLDELDQTEGGQRGQSGDSGVSQRVFGKLLQFMSDPDHRGKILWIGASNRPDNIDPAMMRPGRFDEVLPFLLPDNESRKDIFKKIIKRHSEFSTLSFQLSEESYDILAQHSDGLSGAEIEMIVNEVIRRVVLTIDQRNTIHIKDFNAVFEDFIRPVRTADYRAMEKASLDAVRFKNRLSNHMDLNLNVDITDYQKVKNEYKY